MLSVSDKRITKAKHRKEISCRAYVCNLLKCILGWVRSALNENETLAYESFYSAGQLMLQMTDFLKL